MGASWVCLGSWRDLLTFGVATGPRDRTDRLIRPGLAVASVRGSRFFAPGPVMVRWPDRYSREKTLEIPPKETSVEARKLIEADPTPAHGRAVWFAQGREAETARGELRRSERNYEERGDGDRSARG